MLSVSSKGEIYLSNATPPDRQCLQNTVGIFTSFSFSKNSSFSARDEKTGERSRLLLIGSLWVWAWPEGGSWFTSSTHWCRVTLGSTERGPSSLVWASLSGAVPTGSAGWHCELRTWRCPVRHQCGWTPLPLHFLFLFYSRSLSLDMAKQNKISMDQSTNSVRVGVLQNLWNPVARQEILGMNPPHPSSIHRNLLASFLLLLRHEKDTQIYCEKMCFWHRCWL